MDPKSSSSCSQEYILTSPRHCDSIRKMWDRHGEDVAVRRATAIVEDLIFLFVRDWLLYSHLLSVSKDIQGVALRS